MNRFLGRWTPAFAIFLVQILSGCFSGGGTEDTNDVKVSGQLLDAGGQPAHSAMVILYPEGWRDTLPGSNPNSSQPETLYTDSVGRFQFGRVRPGVYSVQGFRSTDSAIAYLTGLTCRAGQDQTLSPLTLRLSGSLRGQIRNDNGVVSALWIAGTHFQARVDSTGRFDFPILPSGPYELILLDSTGQQELYRQSGELEAGLETQLPALDLSLPLSWRHRSRIVLNTGASGANLAENLAGFPLQIRLDSGFNFSGVRTSGIDLRFSGSDGNSLPFEIEIWNAAARSAVVWVRLDTLFEKSESQALWMYWGNDTASAASNGAGVFDTNGFAGRWHLQQDPASPSPQISDASGNANHGALQGTGTLTAPGISGPGLTLNGINANVQSSKLFNDPDVFTISVWFRTTRTGGKLAGFESMTPSPGFYRDRHIWLDDTGYVRFGVFPPAPANIPPADSIYWRNSVMLPGENPDMPDIQRTLSSRTTFADGNWHQVTATLSPAGQFLYADGNQVAANPQVTTGAAFTGIWRFGGGTLQDWVHAPQREYFQGDLDEASVDKVARSPAWIRLQYLNLASPSTWIRLESPF